MVRRGLKGFNPKKKSKKNKATSSGIFIMPKIYFPTTTGRKHNVSAPLPLLIYHNAYSGGVSGGRGEGKMPPIIWQGEQNYDFALHNSETKKKS